MHPNSMVVFDISYNYYNQFAIWTMNNVFFVTRIKKNAIYEIIQTVSEHKKIKGKAMVLCEEIIELTYIPEDANGKKLKNQEQKLRLKKVCYQDEKNRYYEFISNSMDSTAEEIAFLYKKRWGIELLFKKMKQNFQLHYFYGESENAIRTQVWCTLIAQLLLTVVQKMAQAKKAFSIVASLIRIHLISLLDVYELLRSTTRTYIKQKPPPIQQGQHAMNFM